MTPEELEQIVNRTADAVESERQSSAIREDRIAHAASEATTLRAEDAARVIRRMDEERDNQLKRNASAIKNYQWGIMALIGALCFVIGILIPVWLDRPQIKMNSWRLDKMEVEYPKKIEDLKILSEKNAITLVENSEKLSEMKALLIALRAQR